VRTEFDAFYRANSNLIYSVALARVGDPGIAEDLTQETFIRAWRHYSLLAGLPDPARRAWLLQTVRNLATDLWRRPKLPLLDDPNALAAATVPQDLAELRMDVDRALQSLEHLDREAILLRYYLDMNSREIGAALGLPESTVRHRLARCRRHLAQLLAHWDPGELK
jgi:RNA polymerase sigma-70 factor, ECF subfamily